MWCYASRSYSKPTGTLKTLNYVHLMFLLNTARCNWMSLLPLVSIASPFLCPFLFLSPIWSIYGSIWTFHSRPPPLKHRPNHTIYSKWAIYALFMAHSRPLPLPSIGTICSYITGITDFYLTEQSFHYYGRNHCRNRQYDCTQTNARCLLPFSLQLCVLLVLRFPFSCMSYPHALPMHYSHQIPFAHMIQFSIFYSLSNCTFHPLTAPLMLIASFDSFCMHVFSFNVDCSHQTTPLLHLHSMMPTSSVIRLYAYQTKLTTTVSSLSTLFIMLSIKQISVFPITFQRWLSFWQSSTLH